MKKLLLIIFICIIRIIVGQSQCFCDFRFDIKQDPLSPCCFDITFCNNGGPNCNPALNYGPLYINTNSNPFSLGEIGSVTSSNPNIIATQSGYYQAIFSSNFIALSQNCNAEVSVGRICLYNVPSGFVTFTAQMNQQGNICDLPLSNSNFTVPACSHPILFEKIYGDSMANYSTAIKAFGDGLYVSGYRVVNNAEYGTFSKFDLTTGALIWEKQLSVSSRIVDFEYEPSIDSLFLIGWTSPLSASVNNRSFFIRIGKNGGMGFSKFYDQPGREGFTRIVRHTNPLNPSFPYYILGRKNAIGSAPSADDIVVLFNVNAQGQFNWTAEYAYNTNPADNEFFLGLVPLKNGKLLMTGLTANNDGIILEIDGLNGNANAFYYAGQPLDIYDAIEIGSGWVIIVGENFASHEAILVVLHPLAGYTSNSSAPTLQFPNITNFKDIWTDGLYNLYVVGENKNSSLGLNFPVVHKIHFFEHAGLVTLTPLWAKYFYDFETGYSEGHISVTPTHDRIFYTDSRLRSQPLFGNWDILVGSYDLDLNAVCVDSFPMPHNPIPITATNVGILPVLLPEPPFISPAIQNMAYCCTNFCSSPPCQANFTWSFSECFTAQFTAASNHCLAGIYTYEWDFDGDGTIDATNNSATINYTYPCGGGTYNVCLTITDPLGCAATICYMVNVPNTCCGKILSTFIACADSANIYYFYIIMEDPQIPGLTNCSYSFYNTNPGANVISSSTTPTATGAKLEGFILVPSITPLNLTFTIQSNCICPSGAITSCTMATSIPTPCCKRIHVDDQFVCANKLSHDVPIVVTSWPPLQNVSSVSWYVQPAPPGGCPAGPPWGGIPFQQGPSLPLHLYPNTLNADLCVYAVVQLNDGPCTELLSNIATVRLCSSPTCSINSFDSCYYGTCIIPGPLTLSLTFPPNPCPVDIIWLDYKNDTVQMGGLSYTPTACLNMTNVLDCYEDFFFTAIVKDDCGEQRCKARVRLYSDQADPGILQLIPFEPLPLCLGGDATLKFTPGCSGAPPAPKTWNWFSSLTGNNYSPLPAGTMNPVWNINKTWQHTWFAVTSTNGVCPEDSVYLDVDIRQPLQVTYFDAQLDIPCLPTSVIMEVQFDPPPPDPNCPVTVEWYKDGNLIGLTNPPATSPSFFTYVPPVGQSTAGNYYCIISNQCCVEKDTSIIKTFYPSMIVKAGGPCFICNMQPVNLEGVTFNVVNGSCTYSWTTTNGNIISQNGTGGAVVDKPGIYVFTATCTDLNGNVCTLQASFVLVGCTTSRTENACGLVDVNEAVEQEIGIFEIFPNPTTGEIAISWSQVFETGVTFHVLDLMGRHLQTLNVSAFEQQQNISLVGLSAGLYFIKKEASGRPIGLTKVVKE